MKNLQINILRKSGILFFSIFLIFYAEVKAEREIELQFHEIREKYKIDPVFFSDIGIKKLIFRSFSNGNGDGGLLFKNSHFRTLYPAIEKLSALYNKKFSFWGWMTGRSFTWLKRKDLFDVKYYDGKKNIIKKIDIFNPEAKEKILGSFRDLASVGVSGILIQDDLVLRQNEGFSKWGMKKFAKEAKVPAREKLMVDRGTPYNLKWITIKKKTIILLINDIIRECKKINPDIKTGINIFYETALNTKLSEEWYSHNLEEIVGTGIDRVYLMAYHRQMKKELKFGTRKVKEEFKNMIDNAYKIAGSKLVIKMEIYDWDKKEVIPLSEIESYLNLIPAGVNRICFTPVKAGTKKYFRELVRMVKKLKLIPDESKIIKKEKL
ncbi:MAG: poly-beta-1,6-N-acetyl-D-glucosamine N-deacetylase PgaB [Acidobacteriota bacterium]